MNDYQKNKIVNDETMQRVKVGLAKKIMVLKYQKNLKSFSECVEFLFNNYQKNN